MRSTASVRATASRRSAYSPPRRRTTRGQPSRKPGWIGCQHEHPGVRQGRLLDEGLVEAPCVKRPQEQQHPPARSLIAPLHEQPAISLPRSRLHTAANLAHQTGTVQTIRRSPSPHHQA
jgi:hypothetical protein